MSGQLQCHTESAHAHNEQGEPTNRLLQMNRLDLSNYWLKFKSSGKLPIILEESVEYSSN